MTVTRAVKPVARLSIFLFGKPAWELERLEGGDVDISLIDEIAGLGDKLKTRLTRVAQIARKLLNNGWEGYGLLYDMDFCKEVSLESAQEELRSLGIGEDEIALEKEENDDSDEET